MSYHVIPILIAIRGRSLFNSGAHERGLLRGLGFSLKRYYKGIRQANAFFITSTSQKRKLCLPMLGTSLQKAPR